MNKTSKPKQEQLKPKPVTVAELRTRLMYLYDHADKRYEVSLARIATEALIGLGLIDP